MALPATLRPAHPPQSSRSSALRRVPSRLKCSPVRVNNPGGRGAPRAGMVTRFPPRSAYGLLPLPPPPPPPPTFPVLGSSLQFLSQGSHRPPSHFSRAAARALLGRGRRGKGAPAPTCSSTISGNPTLELEKPGRMQQVKGARSCVSLTQDKIPHPPRWYHHPHPPSRRPPRQETLPRSSRAMLRLTRELKPGTFVVLKNGPQARSRSYFKCIRENTNSVKSLPWICKPLFKAPKFSPEGFVNWAVLQSLKEEKTNQSQN